MKTRNTPQDLEVNRPSYRAMYIQFLKCSGINMASSGKPAPLLNVESGAVSDLSYVGIVHGVNAVAYAIFMRRTSSPK